MRVHFWHSDKPRERLLSEAFLVGVRAHGDTVTSSPLEPEPRIVNQADVVCMVGVKSRRLYQENWRAGVHSVYLDKGYTRHSTSGGVRSWEFWRVAVDAHHPTHYLPRMKVQTDRLERLGLELQRWRRTGRQVVFAGSSAKYHAFYGLSEPTDYATKIVKRLGKVTHREIVYRPKPSWHEAVPVPGATFQTTGSITEALEGAHALVTHGSNAVFEALLLGIPAIVLGDAVTKHLSSQDVAEVENPKLAPDEERVACLARLAYCQWTQPEMASGEAWSHIRPFVYG